MEVSSCGVGRLISGGGSPVQTLREFLPECITALNPLAAVGICINPQTDLAWVTKAEVIVAFGLPFRF